jgi:hypothetical protein
MCKVVNLIKVFEFSQVIHIYIKKIFRSGSDTRTKLEGDYKQNDAKGEKHLSKEIGKENTRNGMR